jgi:hypothetical protein
MKNPRKVGLMVPRLLLLSFVFVESDELVPVDGKDDVYDGVMEEITELEQGLEDELTKLEKKLGYVFAKRCMSNAHPGQL